MASGLSIVICCHNSASRLGPTLGNLARQTLHTDMPWEVLVVDNGSTDATAAIAVDIWPKAAGAPLRVMSEPRLGLSYARAKGFQAANYDIVSFIDDDNWVCSEWVRLVAEIMTNHPDAGACGGQCEAVCEVEPPDWFPGFCRSYAIGQMAPQAGDVTWTRGYLWGAGISIRKQAWQALVQQGFSLRLSGRKGTSLSAGEDTEICLALRLAGWRLYYDPRLCLRHFIPRERLTWEYLCRQRRGMGISSVAHDAYRFASETKGMSPRKHVKQSWLFQFAVALWHVIGCEMRLRHTRLSEGDKMTLEAEWHRGRLTELWKQKLSYGCHIRQIRYASWRTLEEPFEARTP